VHKKCTLRFIRFYTELGNYYASIRDEIKKLQAANKPDDDVLVYLKLAAILKNIVALQNVKQSIENKISGLLLVLQFAMTEK
jgi:hypothetical protein